MLSQGRPTKRGRGRPSTTGEWVGVERVRKELDIYKKMYEEVYAERDVLAGRFETTFGVTAGKIPSADDMRREFADETVDSLLNIVLEEIEAVERVAERSGNLKTTFKGRLRAVSRRAVAASKLMFTRATTRGAGDSDAEALDQKRRELRIARGLIDETENKIRRLEEEVKILRAKETLRAYRTRDSPPPCHIPPFEVDIGGD